MLPGIPKSGSEYRVNKSCYTESDKPGYAFKIMAIPNDIGEYIRNPHCYNVNYYMDMKYYNLWDADNSSTAANNGPVIKTVYDPCPWAILFMANAYSGFTYNGAGSSGDRYGTYYNSPYRSQDEFIANQGYLFYCNKMNGKVFSIPTAVRFSFRLWAFARILPEHC